MTDLPTDLYLAIKASMLPRDTNKHGTIFGGVLLSQMDLAADIGARHVIQKEGWPDAALVTVAMDSVEFKEPVFVGDTVSFWTQVTRIGRSSIAVQVNVKAERAGKEFPVTEALVTCVAVKTVDGQRKTVPIRG